MANNPLYYDAAINAFTALLNSGFIEVYTGAQPALDGALTGTLLVTLTFGNPAFAASSGGVAVANAIGSGTAGNSGTAGYCALLESDGVTVVATGSVGVGGADLNLTTLSIVTNAVIACQSFTITG